MTCRRVPWVHPTCPCGRPLQLGVDHGDDLLGNPLCPTCSGCGCEPEERKTMNDPPMGERPDPEDAARRFHETYERLAPEFAAIRLRKLDAIEEAARSAVREIRASHYQDPLVRTLCVVCGAADGSYPCSALVEADALADALGGTEP